MTTINLHHCREQVNGRVLYVPGQKKLIMVHLNHNTDDNNNNVHSGGDWAGVSHLLVTSSTYIAACSWAAFSNRIRPPAHMYIDIKLRAEGRR